MPSASEVEADEALLRLKALREQIKQLAAEHSPLVHAVEEADGLLAELQAQREHLLTLNQGLARAAAESAELLAEIENKNRALQEMNRELSMANARAAELIGEIEDKNARIDSLNQTLATANATAAELVAELEIQRLELEKANAALRQTNEEKGHILGVVAHDLRSGVGGMGGLAELLAEELAPEQEQAREFVQLMQDESKRLLHLLSTLLDMSRLEQGRLQLRLEIFDLRALVTESVEYHRHFAELKQQTLSEEISPAPLLVAGDRVRLRQVLDNFLSNAIKFSPRGGTIRVRSHKVNREVSVEVHDSGPGLTQEDAGKVFKSFQQLSAKPTGGEESHGLGLAIAKKVIESHHGRIWAENSADAGGAVFGFALLARD